MSHRWEKPPNAHNTEIAVALGLSICFLGVKAVIESAVAIVRWLFP